MPPPLFFSNLEFNTTTGVSNWFAQKWNHRLVEAERFFKK